MIQAASLWPPAVIGACPGLRFRQLAKTECKMNKVRYKATSPPCWWRLQPNSQFTMSEEYKHVTAWVHCHLTPDGWVAGSTKDEDDVECSKPVPADRVLTLCHETAGSQMRGKSTSTRVVWRAEDLTLVHDLKEKFGPQPRSFW